uniref:THUMP domain-containing protein 1-like isoform X2 n=1 Tax=Crassostrea virginica TaxID=6565 RepID=A0A8B8CCR7_CRAVI|nr:THUMP domain-containing protein 1-like isoform X2 [Crassostrea virginica]
MSERKGKKRPKSYYIKCANKKPKKDVWKLEPGIRGFLVSCNNNERGAVRDAYNLLNEYADKLYGAEKESSSMNDEDVSEEEEEEEDIEKAMKKEVQEIKEAKHELRRFQNTNTKAKNLIFIRTTLPDPSQLAHAILSDLWETQVQKSRFAIRLLPISGTCRAEEDDVKRLGKELFMPIFQTKFGEGYYFSITVKIRNNNGLSRDSVIPALAGIIMELNPLHRVSHEKPDYVILVEVIQSVCCIGIVKDFIKFRKYNMQEVVKARTDGVSKIGELDQEENVPPDTVSKMGGSNQEDNVPPVENENVEEEEDTKPDLTMDSTAKIQEINDTQCEEVTNKSLEEKSDCAMDEASNPVSDTAKKDDLGDNKCENAADHG